MQQTDQDLENIFNRALSTRRFSPEVYGLVLQLGGAAFLRVSGSTNLAFTAASRKAPAMLRLDLAANERGYTRLKIYCTSPGVVAMCFYTHQVLVDGRELVTNTRMLSPVEWEHMATVFEHETGIYMQWSNGAARS